LFATDKTLAGNVVAKITYKALTETLNFSHLLITRPRELRLEIVQTACNDATVVS